MILGKDFYIEEYRKCVESPAYFIENYCYIQNPKYGKIKFALYEFQKDVLSQFQKFDYNIILKSRQLGISALCSAYSMWAMLFRPDTNILVLSKDRETAKNIVVKVKFMFDNLPDWLKDSDIKENNKHSIKLSNGSQIKALSGSPSSGRSDSVSILILDEAAFIRHIDEIWASAQQTLSFGGKCIVLSTPNGMGNWFYNMWQLAERKENKFNPIRLDWRVHPERDQAWRDAQTKLLGDLLARQECDADFVTSGNTVISYQTLNYYQDKICKEPIEKRGDLWIWQPPEFSKNYVIGVDVSSGSSGDYTAIQVIDSEVIEQVAEFQGKIETPLLTKMLYELGKEYNNALLAIESNNLGISVIQQVYQLGYKNLYYTPKTLLELDYQERLKGVIESQTKGVAGFNTNVKTRPLLIAELQKMIENKFLIIYSKRLISELRTFVWNGNKAEASKGKHDDLTIAIAIALYVRENYLKFLKEGEELNKKIMERGFGKTSSNHPSSNNEKFGNRNRDYYRGYSKVQHWDFEWQGIKMDLREWL